MSRRMLHEKTKKTTQVKDINLYYFAKFDKMYMYGLFES